MENKASKPDYDSYDFNYRLEKFTAKPFPIDESKCATYAALPTLDGILPHTNGQASILSNNTLRVQLFDKDHNTGLHIDSVIGNILIPWLSCLRQDEYRKDALKLLYAGLFRLDQRAMSIHGFADSEKEREVIPPVDNIPSLEDWICIWKRLHN